MATTAQQPATPAVDLGPITVRDLAAWAWRLKFVRHRFTANDRGRRWVFTSKAARGSFTVAHQPHMPFPWTVEIDAGLERVELVHVDPARILIAAHLLGAGSAKRSH